MKAQNSKKNDNFFAYLIGLFFLASSVVFGIFVLSEDHLNIAGETEGQSELSSTRKITELDKVNDHLKSVSDKMEYERLKTLVANMKASHDTTPSQPVVSTYDDQPIVELENDMREKNFAQQLGRMNEIKKPATDPRSVVYDSVMADRAAAKVKEEEKRQAAKDFLAKARKDGWIVNLDADFNIKSYRHVDDVPKQGSEINYQGFPVVPK